MQRWIAMGVVALLLMGAGGFFAIKIYKESRPAPVWVPLAINPGLPISKRDEIIAKIRLELTKPERLVAVSKDMGLVGKWKLASDEACATELGSRLFVREGEADTPTGKVPAIHVGLKGTRKEMALSGEIAMRMMDDVWKIMGVDPPPKAGQ